MAFRQGGQADLGLIGVEPREDPAHRRRSWEFFGAPHHWNQKSLEDFLSGEGWKEINVRSRLRRQGQTVRIFHAISPPFRSQGCDSGFWQHTNTSNSCHITISLQGPRGLRKRPSLATEWVSGLKKKWTGTAPVVAPPAPQDSDLEDTINPEEGATPPAQESPSDTFRCKRPKVTPSTTAVGPATTSTTEFPAWTCCDDHGSGDCGFRAIARALAHDQGKDLSKDKIVTEASRLRTFAVGHLLKNKDQFVTNDQRAGAPEPASFEDYVMLASRRNFWIDGLLLHALSTRLGRILIVFVWNVEDSAWERHVLAPEFEKNLAKSIQKGSPLCLLLWGGHYRSLLPHKATVVPEDWLRETPGIPPLFSPLLYRIILPAERPFH